MFRRQGAESGGWVSLVLRPLGQDGHLRRARSRSHRKLAYYLGHDGLRFAETTDMRLLDKYHPEVRPVAGPVAARHVAMLALAD